MAAAAAILGNEDLFVHAAFELGHMGDDTYQALALREVVECVDRHSQRILVKRAKALVHKHRVEPNAAGARLDLV